MMCSYVNISPVLLCDWVFLKMTSLWWNMQANVKHKIVQLVGIMRNKYAWSRWIKEAKAQVEQ
jgi:hypothetical protein